MPGEELLDAVEIEELIRAAPEEARDAWHSISGNDPDLPSIDGLRVGAEMIKQPLEQVWASLVHDRGLTASFVQAISARGFSFGAEALPSGSQYFEHGPLNAFLARSDSFRCLIRRNGRSAGSGILVGPSLVLTAWHVIAVAPPDMEQEPHPELEVEFADARRISARIPVTSRSLCEEGEYLSTLPRSDSQVAGKADVALLELAEPAGLHLGFAKLGTFDLPWPGRRAVAVVQYPEGDYKGIGFGHLAKLRNLTARWGHDVCSAYGSSGGGCFDNRFLLAGIHQGRTHLNGGRLVPVAQFPADMLMRISRDTVPESMWSLDGSVSSPLVIGRERLFIAYHAAMVGPERARGIWIKRTDWRDRSGIGFSFELLERLVDRLPDTEIVRISFETIVPDHPDEIARRATAAGFAVDPVRPADGAGVAETAPEAMMADRSKRLAGLIDAEARRQDKVLWLFFEHPAVLFGDEPRWAIAAFVDEALRLSNLRIALAGYETMQMAGVQFQQPLDAEGPGDPGLMIEYLNGFDRNEVMTLTGLALAELGWPAAQGLADRMTDSILDGLGPQPNGRYSSNVAGEVARKVSSALQKLPAPTAVHENGGGRP
jgi:hypothetical protein